MKCSYETHKTRNVLNVTAINVKPEHQPGLNRYTYETSLKSGMRVLMIDKAAIAT